ncbi:hypothetical protein ACH5RR_014894 [Cinchona calisaya]|uniref:Gnk2-homologous domain-containing protein n=1 Tax=Cinchona calisaya TaxID=153742 RepID=A0ABD2ZV38_9GENT
MASTIPLLAMAVAFLKKSRIKSLKSESGPDLISPPPSPLSSISFFSLKLKVSKWGTRIVNTDVCAECVLNDRWVILQQCPDLKVAGIWYDECLLRYTDKFMLSKEDTEIGFGVQSKPINATDSEKFQQVLGDFRFAE